MTQLKAKRNETICIPWFIPVQRDPRCIKRIVTVDSILDQLTSANSPISYSSDLIGEPYTVFDIPSTVRPHIKFDLYGITIPKRFIVEQLHLENSEYIDQRLSSMRSTLDRALYFQTMIHRAVIHEDIWSA